MTRITITIVFAALALAACSVEANDPASTDSNAPEETAEVTGGQAAAEAAPADTEPAASDTPAETETAGQESARRSVESYLSLGSGFSRSGLIEQLEFEGYTPEEAVYGADSLGVDWREQAALSAESYLDLQGFSRSGLIEQLEFEGYTPEEAVYGADAVGL